jgi:hypothetical protein
MQNDLKQEFKFNRGQKWRRAATFIVFNKAKKQARSTSHILRPASEKIGLHEGNMKFGTGNKE